MSTPWIQAPHNYKYPFRLVIWKQAPVRNLRNTCLLTVHVAPFWHSCCVHSSLSNWHLSPSHPVVHTQLKSFTKSWNGKNVIPVDEQHPQMLYLKIYKICVYLYTATSYTCFHHRNIHLYHLHSFKHYILTICHHWVCANTATLF